MSIPCQFVVLHHQNHSKTIHYSRKGEGAKEEDASVKAVTLASIIAVLLTRMVIHRVTQMYRMTVITCANDHCNEDYDNNSY